jgi:hypothetical protein
MSGRDNYAKNIEGNVTIKQNEGLSNGFKKNTKIEDGKVLQPTQIERVNPYIHPKIIPDQQQQQQ